MSKPIIPSPDYLQILFRQWMEAEQGGEQFPVPFHDLWNIAGHSRKEDAIKLIKSLMEDGFDYFGSTRKTSSGGRPRQLLFLTTQALESFCLASQTEVGRDIRKLYIQAKRKWDLVAQEAPGLASEIEALHLKAEIAKQEAIKAQAEQKTIELRHYVSTSLPPATQQKILGYKVIEAAPIVQTYREDQLINDGSTANKSELCRRYGLLTKAGKPNYKDLNSYLALLPSEAKQLSSCIRENEEIRRDWIPELDRLIDSSTRQTWLGE